jgi:tRNA(fMet)-specific endonuclease VapC
MTRFLLDTGSAGDYIHRRMDIYERARAAVAAGHRVGIGLPVLAELWYGVENSSTRERNADRLRRVLSELILWPLTEQAAEEYGRIAAELRRIGRPIGKIDMLIAAIAVSLGRTTIVSADNDLTAVPGVTVENWSATRDDMGQSPLSNPRP